MTTPEQEPRPPFSDLVAVIGGMTTVGLLTERLPVEMLAEHQGKLVIVAATVTALALQRLQGVSRQPPSAEDSE